MYDLLKGKLEGLQGEMMSFAQDLLRTRSLTRDESSAAALVEKQLRALDLVNKMFLLDEEQPK